MELLQLWRSIRQQAAALAEAVERLPDHCACEDADAHLSGRCPCCGGAKRPGEPAGRNDCQELLGRLGADIMMLSGDVAAAGPRLEAAAVEGRRIELRREVYLTANGLQQVIDAFRRATEAVAGFRRECAASRMRAVKRGCAALRDHCERVDVEVSRPLSRGQGPDSGC
jgi:hypothetical protein